jgi:hypothetical protein
MVRVHQPERTRGDLPGGGRKRAHGRNALVATGKPDGHHAGTVGEECQGLRVAEHVGEAAGRIRDGRVRGDHDARLIDQKQQTAVRERALRHALGQSCELRGRRGAV